MCVTHTPHEEYVKAATFIVQYSTEVGIGEQHVHLCCPDCGFDGTMLLRADGEFDVSGIGVWAYAELKSLPPWKD